jgi:stage II sporulation protein D
MSQFGAYGMANGGASYRKILGYYYPGTTLGRVPNRDLRVLIADGRQAVTISSTVPFTASDALGRVYKLAAGAVVLGPALRLVIAGRRTTPLPPLLFRAGKGAILALDGHPYPGRLEVSTQSALLHVVDVVGIESYVAGVVAGEMPDRWPPEALKAQAIAARSYALANILKGKQFDLYADQRSQVYLGATDETSRISAAVRSTAGQVVLYGGQVASTMYFSSSGGRTASAADVFGVSIPYLVSRPDPWDKASPYHRWGPLLVGARSLQAKLDLPTRVVDLSGNATSSGRLRSVTVETTEGASRVPATLLQASLGLRSTWIRIGVLRLDRPQSVPVYGSSLQLTGVARNVAAPQLSASLDGFAWAPLGKLARGLDGGFSVPVRPTQTTRYRIDVHGVTSPALLVRVAPRVRLLASAQTGGLSGSVRPKLQGARVAVERLAANGWKAVAKTVVDQAGAFRADLAVPPGSYRARVSPTSGYAEGVAPTLTVAG